MCLPGRAGGLVVIVVGVVGVACLFSCLFSRCVRDVGEWVSLKFFSKTTTYLTWNIPSDVLLLLLWCCSGAALVLL